MKQILSVHFKAVFWLWKKILIGNPTFNSKCYQEAFSTWATAPLIRSLWCFVLMISLSPAVVRASLSPSTTVSSYLIWKRPSTYTAGTSTENVHSGSNYVLPFSGPGTGVQSSSKGVRRGCRTPTAGEISQLSLAPCSEKAFTEHVQLKLFQFETGQMEVHLCRLEKAPAGQRAISPPHQKLF